MASQNLANSDSGNGLVLSGTKPLPEPMLTCHHYSPITFIWGQFHMKYFSHQLQELTWKLLILKFQTSQGLTIIICIQWLVIYSAPSQYHQWFQRLLHFNPIYTVKVPMKFIRLCWNGSTEQEFNIQFVHMTGVGVGGCVGYVSKFSLIFIIGNPIPRKTVFILINTGPINCWEVAEQIEVILHESEKGNYI